MSTDDEFGPQEALAYLLFQNVQEGKELSQEDWSWLYSRAGRNKPATLEQFKTEVARMLCKEGKAR